MIYRITKTTTERRFETYQEASAYYNRFLDAHRKDGIIKVDGQWRVIGTR